MLQSPPDINLIWKTYKLPIIALSLLILIYFLLRLTNLLIWPIFADEAIYVRWAQVMRAEPTLRFLPLTDGKQPLFMWLIIPFHKFISDPLYAGRLVSVLAGLGSTLGIYLLTQEVITTFSRHTKDKLTTSLSHPQFKQITSLLAAALYVLTPYTLFFDRYALADSLLNMFAIFSMYLALRNFSNPRFDLTLLTGATLGAAWLTKSPAIFFLMLLPALMVIKLPQLLSSRVSHFKAIAKNDDERSPTTTHPLWQITRLIISWLISAVIAYAIYNLLRLGPEFHQINLRNQDYLYPLSEVLTHPTEPLLRNLKDVLGFYWILLTPGIFLCAILGIAGLLRHKKLIPLTIWLVLWTLGPLIAQSLVAKNVTARYFLFTTTPFLIFAAITLATTLHSQVLPLFKPKVAKSLVFICIFGSLLLSDVLILFAPQVANLPRIERSGYLEEWTAGTGLKQIADFLDQKSQAQTILVGTEGFFGTTPDGLQIYFNKHPRVTVIGNSHQINQVPGQLYDGLADHQVYLLFNDERLHIPDPSSVGLQLIKEFPKATRPDGTHQTLQLFQVTHQPTLVPNN